MRHGLGKQTYFSGVPGVYHVYHGQWKENKRHGIATLTMGRYACKQVSSNEQATSTLLYLQLPDSVLLKICLLPAANGDIFEGNFYEDVKEGAGVYYFAQIAAKYEGVWKNDMLVCGSYVKPKKTVTNVLPFAEAENHTQLAMDIMNSALQTTKQRLSWSEDSVPTLDELVSN